jgi:hypothetical protein
MAGNQPSPGRGGQSQTGGVAAYLRWVRELVIWPESIIAGVAVWLLGFMLTYLPVTFLDVGGGQQLDFAILVYYESVGGVLFDGVTRVDQLGTTLGYQTALDSNAFGVGPALHMLVPALVLLVGGYALAGRHIKQGTTERPLESILAGMSLTIWFALVLFLAVAVADTDTSPDLVVDTSPDLVVLLPVTLLYAGVFTAIGATVRSRARLVSGWGMLGGVGAFLAGLPLFLLGDPFDGSSRASSFSTDGPLNDRADASSLSDVDGAKGWADFLAEFVGEHGLGVSTVDPSWFAALVPLLFGAILAYGYRRDSPAVGLGEGARLATGYVIPVLLVVVAQAGLTAQGFEDQFPDGWSPEAIESMNYLLGTSVRSILLAGIVYPVLFAAIGGAVGAVAYRARQTASQPNRGASREQEPGEGQSTATQRGRSGEQAPDEYPGRDRPPASGGPAGAPGSEDTGGSAPGGPAERGEQPPASGGPGPDESSGGGPEPGSPGQSPAPDERGGDTSPDQPVGGPPPGDSGSPGSDESVGGPPPGDSGSPGPDQQTGGPPAGDSGTRESDQPVGGPQVGDGPADETDSPGSDEPGGGRQVDEGSGDNSPESDETGDGSGTGESAGGADGEDGEQLSPSDILGDEIDEDSDESDESDETSG